MPNTSATGGALVPDDSPAPLEGRDLNRLIQQWMSAIIGVVLDSSMIRPSFQTEPPAIPDKGDAWVAFRYSTEGSDTFPYIAHDGSGDGSDGLQRNQDLAVLASFYDTGTNGLADSIMARFRDGTAIQQNNDALLTGQFRFVGCDEPVVVPSLLKEQWLYRVDLPFVLRRQINRTYTVLNILSADGTLVTDEGLTRDISVTNP